MQIVKTRVYSPSLSLSISLFLLHYFFPFFSMLQKATMNEKKKKKRYFFSQKVIYLCLARNDMKSINNFIFKVINWDYLNN